MAEIMEAWSEPSPRMKRPSSGGYSITRRWATYRAYRLRPFEDLRVVGGCDCGCFSLDFAPNAWSGAGIIADALIAYSDGQKTDLILWGREGEITSLEVVDYDPRVPHRFPEISDLRTWEEHGQASV